MRKTNISKLYEIIDELWQNDRALSEDIKLSNDPNVTLIYALDATEIYNYFFPFQDSNTTDSIFGNNKLGNYLLNDILSSHIFNSPFYNKTVLPPHVTEIRGIFSDNRVESAELMTLMGEAFDIIENRDSDSLNSLIHGIQLYIEGRLSKSSLRSLIFNNGNEIASYVFLLKSQERSVHRRGAEMRRSGVLTSFHQKIPQALNIDIDPLFFKSCFEKFRDVRAFSSINANSCDAYALAIAHSINQMPLSQGKRVKLRIISRAKSMFDVENIIHMESSENFDYERCVRSPTTFLPNVLSESSGIPFQEIINERHSIRKLIKNSLNANDDKSFLQEIRNDIAKRKASTFMSSYRDLNQILIFDELVNTNIHADRPEILQDQFGSTKLSKNNGLWRSLLELLHSEQKVHDIVEEFSRNLINKVQQSALVAVAVSFTEAPDANEEIQELQGFIGRNLIDTDQRAVEKTAMRAVRPIMIEWSRKLSLLSIAFYDQGIQEIFLQHRLKSISFSHLVKTLVSLNQKPYESKLAIAYVYALQDKWEWAYKFADFALKAPKTEKSSHRHEAYFLLGYCRRAGMLTDSIDELPEREIITKAIEELVEFQKQLFSRQKNNNLQFDNRFLSQYGICLALLDRTDAMLKISMPKEFASLGVEPIEIWEKTLEQSASINERVIIYNNILFHLVSAHQNIENKKLDEYIKHFRQNIDLLTKGRYEILPDNILNTILCFARKSIFILPEKRIEELDVIYFARNRTGISKHDEFCDDLTFLSK